MSEETLTNIIMDTGSWTCKLGFSSEDFPRVVIQTVASEVNGFNDAMLKKSGSDSSKQNALKSLCYGGNVLDWNLMEIFWKKAFNSAVSPEDSLHPLLVNYYPNSNKYTKEKQTQIFFENFNVPYYFAISNSLLILYSSGRVTGLVLDSGHTVTSVVPIIDGCAQYYNQSTITYGGNDLTQFFVNSHLAFKDLSQEIKEKHCKVSLDFDRDIQDMKNFPNQNLITLPDGTTYDMKDYSIKAPEGIFRPDVIGKNMIGISDLVMNSLSKCEHETRKDLMNNIIVAGGNTCFLNFNERLQRELQMKNHSNAKIKCLNYSDKITSLWFGGAVISGIGSLQPMWISKSDYDEHGPSIIHRKSF